MMTIDVNTGLSREEARQLWEEGDWQEVALQACRDISASAHADPQDRQTAIGVWGAIIAAGYAPHEDPNGKRFEKTMRDVQLAIVRGRPAGGLDEEQREIAHERLFGLVWLIETVSQICPAKQGSLMEQLRKVVGKKASGGDLPPSDAN
jgi:hypothetical protein